MGLVGKLHPMLVHFPIALILAAAAAELIAIHTGRPAWRTIAVANIRAGAAAGAVTVVAGWALTSAPFIEPSRLLTWHRWTGVAAAAGAIGAALWPSRQSIDRAVSVIDAVGRPVFIRSLPARSLDRAAQRTVRLVFVMGWVSHLEYFWNEPSFAR